ncbi:SRPBCC family protein [Actinomadura rubrisoli]|uniref:SRPBCC family protein n=1 Tax=Actinomadura rubrisoli TaxID=2530368 RepID=A0A4V2YQQ5_9ACTN|nr:SRPBCC family protein [Actinomadura rubrisoli]TDD62967.1 SRPBCC family protein [Actinomadura rubrisoli]
MSARHRLSGRFRVHVPPGEAFELFTPRGEERWAPGWRPRFPADDGTGPGTVFETVHDGETTTWVVVECEPGHRVSYARVTPGHRAGTVTVLLTADGPEHSLVEVTYDLTALTEEAARTLDEFAADYPAFLRGWEKAIRSA